MTRKQILRPTTWYVYTYAFPEGTVFYVGKGCHNRINEHEREAQGGCACKKCCTIRSIWESGKPVQKRIVYETLVEREAFAYENKLINEVYGLENLTNLKGRIAHNLVQQGQAVLSLQALREWAVLTQEELAQFVGVSAAAISLWKAGKKQPRSNHIHRLAVALGVAEQDIISALQKDVI